MRGILGGTGFYRMSGLTTTRRQAMSTPYGLPSGAITFGRIGDCDEIAFLPRHGYGHAIAAHLINYRANLWALFDIGVRKIIAVSATGGIRDDCTPGSVVVPDQIIDYTWGRDSTYVERESGKGEVVQVDLTLPYTTSLREELLSAASHAGVKVIDGATYGCTQGPRFETAAETRRMQRDGCDLVGNTGMPEAALARELGLEYAALCVVTNHAPGLGDSKHGLSFEQLSREGPVAMDAVQQILSAWCHLD